MKKISERVKVDQAFAPTDIATPTTSAWFSMAEYRRLMGVVNVNTVAAGKKVTVQLLQATSSAGAGSKDLSSAVTKTAATGGEKMNLSVEADRLDKGFTHVAVKVTSDTAVALLAAATLVRADGRYGVSMS